MFRLQGVLSGTCRSGLKGSCPYFQQRNRYSLSLICVQGSGTETVQWEWVETHTSEELPYITPTWPSGRAAATSILDRVLSQSSRVLTPTRPLHVYLSANAGQAWTLSCHSLALANNLWVWG